MTAASMLQWGHGDEAVEESGDGDQGDTAISFNGATAMKPWKRAGVGYDGEVCG